MDKRSAEREKIDLARVEREQSVESEVDIAGDMPTILIRSDDVVLINPNRPKYMTKGLKLAFRFANPNMAL